jgi:hypothetical protein
MTAALSSALPSFTSVAISSPKRWLGTTPCISAPNQPSRSWISLMSLRARALLCRGESRGTSTRGRRRRRARERGKRRRKRREGGQMRGRRMARFTPMTRGRGQSLERRLLMTDGECHLVKNLPCPLLLSLPPDLPIGGVLLLHTDLPIGGVGHLHAPPPVTATPMRGPADPSERAHHDCLSPPCRLLAVLIEIVRLIQLTQMTFYKWNTTLRPSSFPPSRLEGGRARRSRPV